MGSILLLILIYKKYKTKTLFFIQDLIILKEKTVGEALSWNLELKSSHAYHVSETWKASYKTLALSPS